MADQSSSTKLARWHLATIAVVAVAEDIAQVEAAATEVVAAAAATEVVAVVEEVAAAMAVVDTEVDAISAAAVMTAAAEIGNVCNSCIKLKTVPISGRFFVERAPI